MKYQKIEWNHKKIKNKQDLYCCNILAWLATMNLADSMRSQDNINKVVSQEREK